MRSTHIEGEYLVTTIDGREVSRELNHSPLPYSGVPQVVTMRQARLALDAAGILPSVQAAINAGSNAAKITWEYSSDVERHNGLVPTMAATLGMTETQIDNLFIAAALL